MLCKAFFLSNDKIQVIYNAVECGEPSFFEIAGDKQSI
jgi:hypothetical protein